MGGKKLPTKKAKEQDARAEKQSKLAKEKEDADWKAAGEGAKTKAQASKEKAAAQRAEADAKRAEAKKLAADEEREMAKLSKAKSAKASRPAPPKVTTHQLQQAKEREKEQQVAADKAAEAAKTRTTTEDSYGMLVDAENVNRLQDGVSARDVDSAIAALSVNGTTPSDPHPERRMKAAHSAFEEAEVARLRMEKPGLRNSQYKDLAWKQWLKSPLNPQVQAAALRAQESSS